MDKNRRHCALQQGISTINKKNKIYIKQTKCKKISYGEASVFSAKNKTVDTVLRVK